MLRATLVPLAFVLALALPAAGDGCVPTTSHEEIDTDDTPAGRYYVAFDSCISCTMPWIYQESNGLDGLQRGDEIHDDTCGGMIPSDTIVF